MILKTVQQIIMEYIKDLFIIKECPEELHIVFSLLRRIKERGDEESCLELKYHCDIIDENLFSAIIGSLLPDIRIEERINDKQSDIRYDERLVEELRLLINHNRAISLGFFYDEKKKLRLNTNRCITYLQQILQCVVKNGTLIVLNQKEGIYEEFTAELIGTILRYLMNNTIADSWKKYYEKDILEGLFREVPRVDSEIIDDSLIALNNGVFNLNTKELVPYDKSHIFTSKSPVNFVRGASCPKFLDALMDIVCEDEKLLMCIQEIFGYTLINNTKAEKVFYFVGVGANGKSFLSDIITQIVGKVNTSNIPLSRFSQRFGAEGMINKLVNIANENEFGGAISSENIKIFASGDRTNIERKYKGDLTYKSTCKLIFLLNRLPDTLDNTHGYYRKILIVPFNRIFKPEEMDRNLKEKASEEL